MARDGTAAVFAKRTPEIQDSTRNDHPDGFVVGGIAAEEH